MWYFPEITFHDSLGKILLLLAAKSAFPMEVKSDEDQRISPVSFALVPEADQKFQKYTNKIAWRIKDWPDQKWLVRANKIHNFADSKAPHDQDPQNRFIAGRRFIGSVGSQLDISGCSNTSIRQSFCEKHFYFQASNSSRSSDAHWLALVERPTDLGDQRWQTSRD